MLYTLLANVPIALFHSFCELFFILYPFLLIFSQLISRPPSHLIGPIFDRANSLLWLVKNVLVTGCLCCCVFCPRRRAIVEARPHNDGQSWSWSWYDHVVKLRRVLKESTCHATTGKSTTTCCVTSLLMSARSSTVYRSITCGFVGNSPGRQLISKGWKVLNTILLCYVLCRTAQTYDIITKVCGPLFTVHVTKKIPYRGVNEWPPERRWRVKRRRGRGDGASCLVGVCPHGDPLRGRQLATNNSSPPFLEDSANTATRLTTLPGDCKRGVVEPTVELYVIF